MNETDTTGLEARAEVFVTGPFPPPVHGMAVATERLAARLATRFDVRRFDIAARPRSGIMPVNVLLRAVAALGTLARFSTGLVRRRPRAVIVAMSAGFAKMFDLLVIAIALLLRRTVYVTHHSFAVFDGRLRQRLLGASRPMLRRCRHIVLCEAMKSTLCDAWRLDPDQVLVLSNAALMQTATGSRDESKDTAGRNVSREPVAAPGRTTPAMPVDPSASRSFCIGFIANLCADKGLWTFLEVVERTRAEGCAVTALIAGPVDPPDPQLERDLRERLGRMTGVEWLGAVHGEQRAAFYRAIDLLVFPTVYTHESEPLVILEALAQGVPVVTTRRGCIASALADGVAVQALDETRFAAAAAAVVRHMARDTSSAERRRTVDEHYQRLCAIGGEQWNVLALRIENGDRPA